MLSLKLSIKQNLSIKLIYLTLNINILIKIFTKLIQRYII